MKTDRILFLAMNRVYMYHTLDGTLKKVVDTAEDIHEFILAADRYLVVCLGAYSRSVRCIGE
jgi:hypothetical protein